MPEFIDDFNARFAVPSRSTNEAHRPLTALENLNPILTWQEARLLSKNLTLQFKQVVYQIQTKPSSYDLRQAQVTVCEDAQATIAILYKSRELPFTIFHKQERLAKIVDSKNVNLLLPNPAKLHKPAPDHPWRKYAKNNLTSPKCPAVDLWVTRSVAKSYPQIHSYYDEIPAQKGTSLLWVDTSILSDMGNKLCPKVILEGTRLTFKTEIAFELNEHPRVVGPRKYRYHSPLISAEWCTFTNYPWGRGPINFEPQEEALALETYTTWARMFELQKYYSWIVDRFHISTIAYQKQVYNKEYDFRWLEERLLPLNFRIVFCMRSPESFEAAREERLKVSGNPSQYNDLSSFIQEQELIRELVVKSLLPSLVLDVSDNNINAAVERVADWLEASGGLSMPD